MRKITAIVLALALMLTLVGCATAAPANTTAASTTAAAKSEGVMTYDEYVAAALDSEVTIEAYVQAKQGWWEKDGVGGVATVYTQDHDGAYFLYDMLCPEEDYEKLVPGVKIKVTGYKAEWSGEIEIVDASFEFAGDDTYIAEALDATALLGTDELIAHQNQFAVCKDMTIEALVYKDSEYDPDIYVTVSKDGATYEFCVENYLTGPDTDVYKTVSGLQKGDKVDIEGFLYWYEGVNTHITGVTKK